MNEALVVFEQVSKHFGSFRAVDSLNLAIQRGEFVAIMGPSGCGKTTTLRMLAGLEQPSSGEIRLSNQRMNDISPWQRERDTPMVWQSLALFPFLNVLKNVEFGLKMRGVDAATRRQKALQWLERMEIAEFAERSVEQLSGGQRQRVALARALVTEPQILLLDEPLSALDANLVVRMQSVLTRLQSELGITFVYVTHSQSEAFAMADRVVIMNQGKIEQVGEPEAIYRSPGSRFVAEFVGTNNILSGTIAKFCGNSSHQAEIETNLGSFNVALPSDRHLTVGEAVSFVISADRITLKSATDTAVADEVNKLQCHLLGEQFIGAMVTLYLEAAGNSEFLVQLQHKNMENNVLQPNIPLWACWQPEDAYILPTG